MTTLFQKIIDREIPAVFVYEDDQCVVIMDKFPTTRGQCLVIPRKPIDYAFDLDDVLYIHCLTIAKKIAHAIDQSLQPIRTCMVIEGFEVPHAHIKLFPCYEKKLVMSGGIEVDDVTLEKIAQQLRTQV
ncbi:HIT family protein [Candidatus Nomurabacteria bacterium]|nr:HIT family protein [Candidatus Nomurabacteria bacterium]